MVVQVEVVALKTGNPAGGWQLAAWSLKLAGVQLQWKAVAVQLPLAILQPQLAVVYFISLQTPHQSVTWPRISPLSLRIPVRKPGIVGPIMTIPIYQPTSPANR